MISLKPLIDNWYNSQESYEPSIQFEPETNKSHDPKYDEYDSTSGNFFKYGKPKRDKLSDPIKLSSPDQLSILIYDILKLPQCAIRKPRSTGSSILQLIQSNIKPLISDYLHGTGDIEEEVELFNNNYKYGFVVDNHKYTPNMDNGFDLNYYNLSMTIYRIQDPLVTIKEKIGTCIDACMLMRYLLKKHNISNQIWLLHFKNTNKVHTILTFEAESKVVYLELTPQSKNPSYGKEIIYENFNEFISQFVNNEIDIEDITEQLIIGEQPLVLINKTNN